MFERIPDPDNEGEFVDRCECGNICETYEVTCGYCGEPKPRAEHTVYVEKNFRPAALEIISEARDILADYEQQGYKMTLRQLYYQFVSRGMIPNKDTEYKKLGGTMNDARLAGLINFEAMEDRNRKPELPYVQEDADEIILSTQYHFNVDMWRDQPRRVEVWVEKDALSSVVARACNRVAAPYLACKGYMSVSAMWESAQRALEANEETGQDTLIVHLGDHDPSGIDMTRDNQDRMDLLTQINGLVSVKRIALNRDQIDRYDPPPNPAKVTDSRAADYIKKHGPTSWELDALEPSVLDDLITKTIRAEIDGDTWNKSIARQQEGRKELADLAENWSSVREYLKTLKESP
jgi:hypothetical protein